MKGVCPQINNWALKTSWNQVKRTRDDFTLVEILFLFLKLSVIRMLVKQLYWFLDLFTCNGRMLCHWQVTESSRAVSSKECEGQGGEVHPVLMNLQHLSPLLSPSPSETLIFKILMESLFLHTSKILYGNPVFMMYKETLPSRLRCFEDTYSYFTSFLEGLAQSLLTSLLLLVVKCFISFLLGEL